MKYIILKYGSNEVRVPYTLGGTPPRLGAPHWYAGILWLVKEVGA